VVDIKGVELIHWNTHIDARGHFAETYKLSESDLPRFVQYNESCSHRGVIRGLHYQYDPQMGKLMRVIRGAAYLVALDIRSSSPTYGEHVGVVLSDVDTCALWAPAGFARGFQALTDNTVVWYACTAEYNRHGEGAIAYNSVGILWPEESTIISPKDRTAPTFDEYKLNPRF
jgi:dTDP-4-dehydrorhamnose 3,5-epimerase